MDDISPNSAIEEKLILDILHNFDAELKRTTCIKAIFLAPRLLSKYESGKKVFHCMISLDQYF